MGTLASQDCALSTALGADRLIPMCKSVTWDGEAALGAVDGGPRVGEVGEQGLRLQTFHPDVQVQQHTCRCTCRCTSTVGERMGACRAPIELHWRVQESAKL